jgi:hypothetical protein
MDAPLKAARAPAKRRNTPISITLPPKVWEMAKKMAKLYDLSLSGYLLHLAMQDLKEHGISPVPTTPEPPNPHQASGDPLTGSAPDQSKKQSGESKFSRGHFVVKDPQIEKLRKPAKTQKKQTP